MEGIIMGRPLLLALIISIITFTVAFGEDLYIQQVDSIPLGITRVELADLNDDGVDEIVFQGNNIYYVGTHRVFIYDIVQGSLIFESEPLGGELYDIYISDINRDGFNDILYSYYESSVLTSYLKAITGPDYNNFEDVFIDTNTTSAAYDIRQVGNYGGNENPLYFRYGRQKIYILGDDFEVESIFQADSGIFGYDIVDYEDQYMLTNYTYGLHIRPFPYLEIHRIDMYIYNDEFELIHEQEIFGISGQNNFVVSYGGFKLLNDSSNQPIARIVGYGFHGPYGSTFLWQEMIPIEGGEPILLHHDVMGGFVHDIPYRAFYVNYSEEDDDKFITWRRNESFGSNSSFLLRDIQTGDSLGISDTIGIWGNATFGDWDNEPGKELFFIKDNYINVYKISDTPTGIDEATPPVPKSVVFSNFPNPFNSSTNFDISLDPELIDKDARLSIFNIYGEKVATLIDGRISSGSKAVRWSPSDLATGIYFARLEVGDEVVTRKLVYLK
ncbi:MAG: T9SS type A sorting domain-containing protein [candidate division Zixibacteria bacterium]|nr:T9SS type A sorting domain-containing protein [candidate division Zixibacteria bacterium]